MKITKELLQEMVKEELAAAINKADVNENEAMSPGDEMKARIAKSQKARGFEPKGSSGNPAETSRTDADRALTDQDVALINTNPEFQQLLSKVLNQIAPNIPQGKMMLMKLYKELPGVIKSLK